MLYGTYCDAGIIECQLLYTITLSGIRIYATVDQILANICSNYIKISKRNRRSSYHQAKVTLHIMSVSLENINDKLQSIFICLV
jgi:hypothetical protein